MHLTLATVITALAGAGCTTPAEQRRAEVRRQLLRAETIAQERTRQIDAQRVTDPNGELLPSNNQVAGITLPRGYEPKFVFEHEWHYDGQLPIKKLESYFLARVDATVERPDPQSIVFAGAKMRGATGVTPVKLTLLPVPGREDWSRIRIDAPRPMPAKLPSALEIENELAARQKNMH